MLTNLLWRKVIQFRALTSGVKKSCVWLWIEQVIVAFHTLNSGFKHGMTLGAHDSREPGHVSRHLVPRGEEGVVPVVVSCLSLSTPYLQSHV